MKISHIGFYNLAITKNLFFFCHRYAHPGNAPLGYSAHVGERFVAVFLRFLHFRHRGSPVVGRYTKAAVRTGPTPECITTEVSKS